MAAAAGDVTPATRHALAATAMAVVTLKKRFMRYIPVPPTTGARGGQWGNMFVLVKQESSLCAAKVYGAVVITDSWRT
jgi:hypothetical protein